jgi:hypothetical protein
MIDGAGSDGYARARKNEVCEKKIVVFDENILESSKIFVVVPFRRPKQVDSG